VNEDVIVAPITATGGAVALVRLSGIGSWKVAAELFHPWSPIPRQAAYGRFVHGDDGLAIPFEDGHSYTGEESVEFSLHGSAASVRLLINSATHSGARLAEPGEFTLRAFMNGKLDLTQAEGVRASVEALSDAQLRQGELLLQGALKYEIAGHRRTVLAALAAVEAATDFEEETGPLDRTTWTADLNLLHADISRLASQAEHARLVREGVTVALAGLPNAGKSSLFNALCGSERAIVTSQPGTTRDLLEAEIQVRGHLVRLVDTAGLREAQEEAEQIGVARSRDTLRNADLTLYCFASDRGWTADDERECPVDALKVATKTDLCPAPGTGIPVSARSGEGVDSLIDRIAESAGATSTLPGLVLPRHQPLLKAAAESVRDAAATLANGLPSDLAAVHLQSALRSLGEITGETASADVLDQVFSQFCIGK
jgi:tRNA modification GTPase